MISVLYVDDEPGLLEIGKVFLEETGLFTVDTSTLATEALEKIRGGGYDAVVSDYQMPGMDGIEFLGVFRKEYPHLPFIIFTGKGREEVAIQAFENGADFYIQKGGDPASQYAELSHKIRKSVEQREAERALREREQRFRMLIQNSSDIIRILDKEGNVIYDSPSVTRFLGYPEDFFIGKRPFDFIHPDDQARVLGDFDEVLRRENRGIPTEFRIRKADGTYIDVESVAMNLADTPGIEGIVITTHPVTERKRAEQALKSSEEMYRILADNVGDVIWVYDLPTARFTYVSPSIEKVRGYTPEEVLSQSFSDMLTPESFRMVEEALPTRLADFAAGIESARVMTHTMDQIHKDGSVIPTEIVTTLLPGPDGKAITVVGVTRDIRERRKFETALQESETRFRRAELLGNLGHWEVHLDTGRVEASQGAREIYGFGEVPLTYETIKALPLPEYRPLLDRAMKDLVEKGIPYVVRFKIRNLIDGSPRDIYSVAEYDPAKRVAFGIIQEITRAHPQPSGHGDYNVFRNLVENLNDVIFCVDMQGYVTYVSPAGRRQFGYFPMDILHHHFTEIVYPEDKPGILHRWQEIQGGVLTPMEWRLIRKDGETSWVRTSTRPIHESGRVVGFEGIISDISSEKQIEQKLRESESRYRTLVESIPDGIFMLSKEGVVTYVNPLGATMLGRDPSGILGHNINEIFPPDVASHQMQTIRTLFGNGMPRRDTTVISGPKGIITFDTYLVPIRDATGEVTSVLGISRDISNLKNKEDALIRINHQLNLLSDITRHDILNKISVISGYMALARKKTHDDAMRELLNKIEPPTTSIRSLIDATKIYQNLGVVEPNWQSLAVIIGGLTPPETLEIVSNVGGVTILADPMLDKVFANLLDNTLRHGVSATRVTVSWEKTGTGICIIWQDNGVGVPEDEKEKIFERGFGKNTGLGLFLVRDILALTHIHIRETGTQGKGARFEMAVPRGMFRYSS